MTATYSNWVHLYSAFNILQLIAHQLDFGKCDLYGVISGKIFFCFKGECKNRKIASFDPFGSCHDNNQKSWFFVIRNMHQRGCMFCFHSFFKCQDFSVIFNYHFYPCQIINLIDHNRNINRLTCCCFYFRDIKFGSRSNTSPEDCNRYTNYTDQTC